MRYVWWDRMYHLLLMSLISITVAGYLKCMTVGKLFSLLIIACCSLRLLFSPDGRFSHRGKSTAFQPLCASMFSKPLCLASSLLEFKWICLTISEINWPSVLHTRFTSFSMHNVSACELWGLWISSDKVSDILNNVMCSEAFKSTKCVLQLAVNAGTLVNRSSPFRTFTMNLLVDCQEASHLRNTMLCFYGKN